MGRAPCCQKMGLKRGPWTPEEDQILVSFVQRFGHENWRALPKQAGLLRCGKSCRLRWMNYLRPDIKRGNFTKEEEEMIIKLHQVLGNRWSAIAEKLPGRTDNEIKNVWHTHLKKKLHLSNVNNIKSDPIMHNWSDSKCHVGQDEYRSQSVDVFKKESKSEKGYELHDSPQCSAITDLSTSATIEATMLEGGRPNATTTTTKSSVTLDNYYVPELLGEDFWTQVLSSNNVTSSMLFESSFGLDLVSSVSRVPEYEGENTHGLSYGDEKDSWCNLFSKMGEFPELLEM